MASLIDLLQSGQLQTGAPDLQDPIEQLKALLAKQQGGDASPMPGVSVAAPSFGSLSPTSTQIPPFETTVTPAPPEAAGSPPATRQPMSGPSSAIPATNEEGLPLGEKVMSFLSGLSGEGGLKTMRGEDKARQTENLTIKTLLDRGIAGSAEEAKAIVRNPASLQAALLSIFAPKGFNLKSDEKRFMPGATPGAPAIEVASGEPGEKILPQGAKLIKNGVSIADNAPKPPMGYQWKDPNNPGLGTVPIPNGPADEKFQEKMRTDKTALDATIANISQAQQEARSLLANKGLGRNFGLPGMVLNVPGFAGADADADLKKFRAKAGFQALQAMRDASKTGGALGNVSNQEGQRLENSAVALDKAQSVEDAQEKLRNYIQEAEGAKQRTIAAYHRAYGTAETRTAPPGRNGGPGGLPDPLGLR